MNAWESNYKTHQGNLGLGRAIAYYTSQCITVLLPLNDSQKYDLAVDIDGHIKKVSIKTTQGKSKSGKYIVQMKNTTLGSSSNTIRRFDNTTCDIVFVITKDNEMYQIPSNKIHATCSFTLTEEFEQYKVYL